MRTTAQQGAALVVVSYAERPPRTRIISARLATGSERRVRGVTAPRYAQGTNVVLLEPDVAQLFPDSQAVNEALRTLARLAGVAPLPGLE